MIANYHSAALWSTAARLGRLARDSLATRPIRDFSSTPVSVYSRSTACQALFWTIPAQPPHSKPLPLRPRLAGNFPRFAILILWRKNTVGRNSQVAISGHNPEPLNSESSGSEFERAAYPCETSGCAVTLVFPTLTHDALCFQPLAAHQFRKPSRIKHLLKTTKKNRRMARVPREAISPTEPGCPRSLAFGDLGDHEPKPAGSRPTPIAVGSPRSFRPIQTTMRMPPRICGPGTSRPEQTEIPISICPHKRPVTRIRHRGRTTACQAPLPVVLSHLLSLQPLTPNG